MSSSIASVLAMYTVPSASIYSMGQVTEKMEIRLSVMASGMGSGCDEDVITTLHILR